MIGFWCWPYRFASTGCSFLSFCRGWQWSTWARLSCICTRFFISANDSINCCLGPVLWMKLTADLSPTPFLLYKTADNRCLVAFTKRRVQAVFCVCPLQTLVYKKAIANKRNLNQGVVNYCFMIGYGSFNTTNNHQAFK